ncbi:uncharacterized protein LACBIDRAFT_301240 [Laccaria bicolor S238N-H82]|uniref:Predicted protein n=1 Tax=Laccaria bicolor (strain S238N-H82 / ATCC MYA-4686) TaxID=486041 RepID=B0CRP6_LACBS|nr:uncharacterized protein LACBIDRAFT_301240 [Laccaria bicolor S238N-H82]EDR15860.1 predicted protein [Laccaria bicolor S238N-H82]|eukprot:XP_001874068.1 predicted protein [Laccaria bicolor S238N-H82]
MNWCHGLHSHGLKQMFTHRQRRKVKFQMWSTIMQLAVMQNKKIIITVVPLQVL